MLKITETPFEHSVKHPFVKVESVPVCDEDDQYLCARFKEGDEHAFAVLYSKYVVKLYHYGERLCRDAALIEDSIHDLFVELWKNRAGMGQIDSVKSYLYRGFKNRLIKNIQKKKKRFHHMPVVEDEQFKIVFSFEAVLIEEQTSNEQKASLLRAIDNLSPRQKEALTLRFFDQLSYQEIASIMMLPVKSVYMLIYRAIDWLKHNIKLSALIVFPSFVSYLI